ncbi:hypothetical protein [Campylobacter mucosalis]|uniref:hypothetical protein n=1 Tax=Campylobacter mucosalis TaxID=202 RepID=UPI0009E4C7C8|nr:hypothetical protein [Campylobacter mucosalis]
MIGKILTLMIVCAVIYLVFFKMLRKKNNQNKEIENFIECEKCGTFVPLKDTILSSEAYLSRLHKELNATNRIRFSALRATKFHTKRKAYLC